ENEASYYPGVRVHGAELVRAGGKEGEDVSELLNPFSRWMRSLRKNPQRNAIYASYLAAISESQKTVWITQAYFAPNQEFRDVLESAARRGVDVRLLV